MEGADPSRFSMRKTKSHELFLHDGGVEVAVDEVHVVGEPAHGEDGDDHTEHPDHLRSKDVPLDTR